MQGHDGIMNEGNGIHSQFSVPTVKVEPMSNSNSSSKSRQSLSENSVDKDDLRKISIIESTRFEFY